MAMVRRRHDDGQEVDYYIHDDVKKKILDKAIDQIHNKNNSFVAVFDARSGTGKTTLVIQYAKYCDPDFNINKMTWQPSKFIEALHNAKQGDAIVLDEGMGLNSRSAISAMNKAIIIALSQIRSKNIFVFIAINSVYDLDKNIAIHRADILFHMYSKDDKVDGERRIKVYGRQKLKYLYINGKKYYNYNSPPNFFARPPRKYVFLFNETEYEKRKQAAIMEDAGVNGNSLGGRLENRYKLALLKSLLILKNDYGLNHIDVCPKIGISNERISKIHRWAKDNNYLEEI